MRWIIAGGGTGGHLFPGIALAQELKRRISGADVLFVGHGKGLTGRILKQEGFEFKEIKVIGIKGQSNIEKLEAMIRIPYACWQSGRIIARYNPRAVLGVGGYSAGPVVLTAALMKKACYIQEQNVYPGLTNRLLARWARRVFVSYPESVDYFPPQKALFTGNPVRDKVAKLPDKAAALQVFGLSRDKFSLLVFGGSQGAHRINWGMLEALPNLVNERKRLQIIHQTGEKDCEWVRAEYKNRQIKSYVSAFIYDMPSAYAAADLIICRAGATTLAEITVAGKPALLVPYPYAANDHQAKNAAAMARVGAAKVIADNEINGEVLSRVILDFINNKDLVAQMAKAAKALGRADASRHIVEYILSETDSVRQS
jgi:UDP-N-acetylglucosamine--N-acetylmuramyl-(pentapeptide) pyrophosphoryl-undecaprenol N-acetylglucosamine transferase